MGLVFCHLILHVFGLFAAVSMSNSEELESLDLEVGKENRWVNRHMRREDMDEECFRTRPTTKDIIRRIYAIIPYFDRDHSNMAFLRKYRATIHGMSDGGDLLDREAAFYGAVITPIVFLHQYRDTWCMLERFHRALRLYQISHPTEKWSALKLLQNFRSLSHKAHLFVRQLPGPKLKPRPTLPSESDDEELHDKKDIRYLKELIKNLG